MAISTGGGNEKVFILAFLMILFNFNVLADGKTLIYKETTGNTMITSTWKIDSLENGYCITATNSNEFHEINCNKDYATLSWEYTNRNLGIQILAQRIGDRILVIGEHKNKEIRQEFAIDNQPWFEFIEVSLTPFIESPDKSKEFWILQPYDLKLYKMVAMKQKIETITVNNNSIEAFNVKVTLSGFASVFWKVNYWFRKTDGVYVRYEGVKGAPGTPKTIVELIN